MSSEQNQQKENPATKTSQRRHGGPDESGAPLIDRQEGTEKMAEKQADAEEVEKQQGRTPGKNA